MQVKNILHSIVVVGSSNTDMVIKADHLPGPGETILGGNFFMNAGGKGANQAVAAARLEGNVAFIAKTGNDIFGKQSAQLFEKEGINTSHLCSDPKNPSGIALITVDKSGENCIVVALGANSTLSAADIQKSKSVIEAAKIVLMQLEIPIQTVSYVAALAAAKGVTVVLNPAPFQLLPDELMNNLSILTPNRTEAEMLSGIRVTDHETAKQAAVIIKNKGIKTVIITLGSDGALVLEENGEFTLVPAVKVNAVDSTAAGDVFNAALAVALSEGIDVVRATTLACQAAAISVTRFGAQLSAPKRNEITGWPLKKNSPQDGII